MLVSSCDVAFIATDDLARQNESGWLVRVEKWVWRSHASERWLAKDGAKRRRDERQVIPLFNFLLFGLSPSVLSDSRSFWLTEVSLSPVYCGNQS
jgi:hypothetical protein